MSRFVDVLPTRMAGFHNLWSPALYVHLHKRGISSWSSFWSHFHHLLKEVNKLVIHKNGKPLRRRLALLYWKYLLKRMYFRFTKAVRLQSDFFTKCNALTNAWKLINVNPFLVKFFLDKYQVWNRGAFFAWRAPILSWPRIMCSQVRVLNFLEPSRKMP